jgi:hypothetical protein
VTGTQLSGFLRSRSQKGTKSRYFKKGKLHSIQKKYLQRNGYDEGGKLLSSRKFMKKGSKNKWKKHSKKPSRSASQRLNSISQLDELSGYDAI